MNLPLRSVLLSVRCIFPSLMHLDVVCIRIILFLVLCYYNDLILSILLLDIEFWLSRSAMNLYETRY